jgi:hypothetical protein
MLVHMAPQEVAGLQALAMKHGGTLTINPDTGLPEAGFLSKILPMLAGAALNYFAPGFGTAISGALGLGEVAGAAAIGTGVGVGGATALATGSLSRGLMAGLGAYGGAGLTEGIAGLGAGELAQEQISANMPTLAGQAPEQIADYTQQVNDLRTAGLQGANQLPIADKLAAGAKSAATNPLAFAKANWMPTAAAALPVLSAIGTTTPMTAKPVDTGYIRQKLYDPYTQTYKTLPPIKASEYGNRSFSDAYTNPQTGEMSTLQPRAPGMAEGGIVALAGGGDVQHFYIGGDVKGQLEQAYAANDVAKINEIAQANMVTAADVADTYKGFDTSGIQGLQLYTPPNFGDSVKAVLADQNTGGGGGGGGLSDLASGAAVPYYFQQNKDVADSYAQNSYGMTPEEFAQAHYTNFGQKEGREFAPSAAANYAKANNLDLVANTGKWIEDNPFATPDQISAAITGSSMSKQDVTRSLDSLVASGKISQADRYYIEQGKGLSAMATDSARWLKDNANATQTQIDAVLKAANMNTSDAQQVLAHGFQVANDQMAAAAKYIQDNPDVARWITSAQGQAYIKEHPEFDAQDIAWTHYTRYGEKEGRKWGLDKKVITTVNPYTGVASGAGPTTGTLLPTNPQTNAPPGTANPYGNVNNPGDLTFNNDGTITVQPNIPGRPYGGFSGMDEVKNAYTAGGGSLGYTPKAPKTMADFEQMYNQQTGDSMAAYNYLMGKAGASYPIQSTAASTATGIMRPYFSAGMKYKPKFLTKNADGTISSSTTSGTAPLTAAKTINVSNPQGLVEVATLGDDGTYHAPSGGTYDVTGKALNVNTTDTTQGGGGDGGGSMARGGSTHPFFSKTTGKFNSPTPQVYADGGYSVGGGLGSLGSYSDGGRLLKGPGDGVSDSIPATIGAKQQPARLADGEFVVPARIVSELGNGSTEAGAKKLYAMMDRVQKARGKTTGKNKVAANSRADQHLPA